MSAAAPLSLGDTLTYRLTPGMDPATDDWRLEAPAHYCLNGDAIHESTPNDTYACRYCETPWQWKTSTIRSISRHADGSATLGLKDGTTHSIAPPHGDACY